MIVECEKCNSRFSLDETLIKDAGSKVRCSVCRHIFMVLPPEEDGIDPAMEETTQLSTPPLFDAEGEEEIDPEVSEIFDQAFEEALKEDIEEVAEVEEVEPRIKSIPSLEKRESKGPGSLMIMLIIILVIVLGAIAVYFFIPSFLPDKISGMRPVNMEEVTDTGNRRLDIADLNSYFLPTDKIGQLYVIEGKIINNYPADRSYIIVKGAIEDENRKTVDQKLVYAGNIFAENELKGMTRKEIDEGMSNKAGKDNSNLNIKPQASVPFMIIFYDLPDDLSEFLVETISSSPAN